MRSTKCGRVSRTLYRPFNINVTTVEPASLPDRIAQKVVIGGSVSDWYAVAHPGSDAGGVAAITGFYDPQFPNVSFVFAADFPRAFKGLALAAAHEAGHGFGLYHQSVWSGNTLVQTYNDNNGSTTGDRADSYDYASSTPLMGYSYLGDRAMWWYGKTQQPVLTGGPPYDVLDTQELASGPLNATALYNYSGLGYRDDDHADVVGSATSLIRDGNNYTLSLNHPPLLGQSVISRITDTDLFSFTTDTSGTVEFRLSVPQFGATLDAVVELLSSAGDVVATATDVAYSRAIANLRPLGSFLPRNRTSKVHIALLCDSRMAWELSGRRLAMATSASPDLQISIWQRRSPRLTPLGPMTAPSLT
jgi:hypothetical protein